jgi:hypothetical protein
MRANVFVNFGEVVGREGDLSSNAGKSFRNVRGNAPPFPF